MDSACSILLQEIPNPMQSAPGLGKNRDTSKLHVGRFGGAEKNLGFSLEAGPFRALPGSIRSWVFARPVRRAIAAGA